VKVADYTIETSDKVISDVCRIAENLLDIPIISAQRIGGSGNNRVYSLQGDHSNRYVAKFYFSHSSDKRDRLQVEFTSLSFLWRQGVADIPRPIAISREKSCAIYEFIEGKKIVSENIKDGDIQCAVNFLGRLKNLNSIAYSQNLLPASDACFSIKAIISNIEGRLSRFTPLKEEGQEYTELKSFLRDDFKPFLTILTQWVWQRCKVQDISFDAEIPREETTLSPSDFGFHNAIRANDGRIVFLDFEYFGWDDPAKTIADFLFHPAMMLSEAMKNVFVQGILAMFKENNGLVNRVELVYPLFGLKWCMIFLNEFIPNDFTRRAYASGNPLDKDQVRKEQLRKARNLCRKIKETYLRFPYANG